MREHEVYETFCQHCLAKFERRTLAEALKAADEHESGLSAPRCPALCAFCKERAIVAPVGPHPAVCHFHSYPKNRPFRQGAD